MPRGLWSWGFVVACHGSGGSKIPGGDDGPPDPGCVLALEVAGASPTAVVGVDLAPDANPLATRPWALRAVSVSGTGATLTVGGGVVVLDEAGVPLGSPVSVDQARDLYVQGVAVGSGSLDLTPRAGCDVAPLQVALQVRPAPSLVGRSLAAPPLFGHARSFGTDQVVEVAVDERDFPDRVGAGFDAWVVDHRDAAAWVTDPALVDVADGPVAGTVAPGRSTLSVWSSDLVVEPGKLRTSYDLVLDFGRDGRLDPGDVLVGGDTAGFSVLRDPTEQGPYVPLQQEWSPTYWGTMVVYAPDASAPSPAPLVVIGHGNGHDYTWYDYLGRHFASWGYVVISHRNDTEPGPQAAAVTTLENTDSFLAAQGSLGLPVQADPDNIGWIGHSRGGEGVVIAYGALVDGVAGVTEYDASDVKLVQSIAPTNFEGPDGANPHGVAFHILSGSADGDVTGGVDVGLTQYYRMFQRGTGDHFVTYVQGADHNDFNCCGADDGNWPTVQGNPPLIGRARAQTVAKGVLLALLERELRGDDVAADWLRGAPERLQPAAFEATVASQAMPGALADKLVIDDFQTQTESTVSSIGGAVTTNAGVFGEGALDDGNGQLAHNVADPVNGMSWSAGDSDPERGAAVEWAVGDDLWVEWEIPATDQDWTSFRELSFRTCQSTRNPQTLGLGAPLSFTVALVDGSGTESAIDFGAWGRATQPYARSGLGAGVGWVNEFQTVRLALADFDASDPRLDWTDVVAVRFRFGQAWGSPQGRAGFDDLELLR